MLHEQLNVLHWSTDIFSHSPFKLVHSSLTFREFFSFVLSFSNFKTFSIGFMSGLWAGYSITVTSSSERNVLTDFAMGHGALSCINTAGWLFAILKWGTTYFVNISLYTVAVILSCSMTRGPVPAVEIMSNIITLPSPNLTLPFSALRRISFLRTALKESSRLNFDSSLKWTQSHCSSVHMKFSVANFSRLILFFLYM